MMMGFDEMIETDDLPVQMLLADGSEAELEYQRAVALGCVREDLGSATIEPREVAAKHSLNQLHNTAADSSEDASSDARVKLAEVNRLPSRSDEADHHLGFVPESMLGDVARIAYAAGVYYATIWEGLESEREAFISGRSADSRSWRIVQELRIHKSPDGRVDEVDLTEEQEREALELEYMHSDAESAFPVR